MLVTTTGPFHFDLIIGLISVGEADLEYIFLQHAHSYRPHPCDTLKEFWLRVKATKINSQERHVAIGRIWSDMTMKQRIVLIEALLRFRSPRNVGEFDFLAKLEEMECGSKWPQLLRRGLRFDLINDPVAQAWLIAEAKKIWPYNLNHQFANVLIFYFGEQYLEEFLKKSYLEMITLPVLLPEG